MLVAVAAVAVCVFVDAGGGSTRMVDGTKAYSELVGSQGAVVGSTSRVLVLGCSVLVVGISVVVGIVRLGVV